MKSKLDMMNVKTCERCGRLFETFIDSKHCNLCMKHLEEQLDDVKQFIAVNDTASMEEVEIALKVPKKQLVAWIREKRLEFPEASGVTLPCQKCGQPVRIGRFCILCTREITAELESVIDKPAKVKSARLKAVETNQMHFLNRRRRR